MSEFTYAEDEEGNLNVYVDLTDGRKSYMRLADAADLLRMKKLLDMYAGILVEDGPL